MSGTLRMELVTAAYRYNHRNDVTPMFVGMLQRQEALLEGHFLLSSGQHSSRYIQCARLFAADLRLNRRHRDGDEARDGHHAFGAHQSPFLAGVAGTGVGKEECVNQVIGIGDNDQWIILTSSQTPMQVVHNAELSRWDQVEVIASAAASWLRITPPAGFGKLSS